VRTINVTSDGTPWLTDRQLEDLRPQILRQPNRTLLEANEAIHALFLKAQVDRNEITGESDPVVQLIDFASPERNRFHAINQFRIDTPGCVKQCIIPDIVLFVNGIPLVVVEAKIGDATTANPMHAAFEQLLRYRNGRSETQAAGLREGKPHLYHSNLLLIRTCEEKAEFGSITSGHEHFCAWKNALTPALSRGERENCLGDYTPPLGVERELERLIQGLLAPATLLDVLRTSTVFMDTDAGRRVKVVCRYQQYRAAHRIVERLRTGQTAEERSGVVWHTQGSGKSLTMVFVARMLRASKDLADFEILLVNDRVDLEDQLAATAKLIGGKVNVIESTAELREHLVTDASDINMVMVHKFMERAEALPLMVAEALASYRPPPSGGSFGVVNPSERILLMIDEAHRTQGSDLGANLFEAFPNATRIAFTGTPLISDQHGGKRTVKRFGEYIDTYKLMDAVHDGATLQILYEGRTADTALKDKHGFDTKFEDLFKNRSEEELAAIRKKYGPSGDILEAEQRIAAIARVNRVTKNKHRGFIVDYIGLANHLMEALSIYSEEDAEDLQQGLKNRLSELPILEERYQRLLQHFRSANERWRESLMTLL
jgi:type I restriction enzyme R subunit